MPRAVLARQGNNMVRTMEAYVDLWWSRDGETWYQVRWASGRCARASECRRVGVVAGRLGERALRTRARRMRRRVGVVGVAPFF